MTDEERKDVENIEEKAVIESVRTRETYDKASKTVNMRKQQITDLKLNNEVTLPKSLNVIIESEMKVRTEAFVDIFENVKKKNCSDEKKEKQKQ